MFLALVALYIALRFEWRMAVAALVTLLHDIVVTVGHLRARRLPGVARHR